jgi:apolipoprotein N-acyltransferase
LRSNTLRSLFVFFAPVLSGVLLALTFPDYEVSWLAWVALVPLLLVLQDKGVKYGFFLSFLCGLVFFPGIGHWLFEISGYKLLHHVIWDLYLAIYFGLFGLSVTLLSRRLGTVPALFATPFLWVSLEYLRSNMGFMAFPWGLLSHSQYQALKAIQIASFTGHFGVSFVVAMVNSAVAGLILALGERANGAPVVSIRISRRATAALSSTAAVFAVGTLIYGHYSLSKPIEGKPIKVTVVQGNIEQGKKWDPDHSRSIMSTYTVLTQEASKEKPDLIVWPEAATPGLVLKRVDLYSQILKIVKDAGTHFMIGSSEYPKLQKTALESGKTGNTALFFSPEGKILSQYLKIRLLPFGEYLPMEETIPWSYLQIPTVGSHIRGEEFTVFHSPDFSFAPTICWETIFPELIRQFVRSGGQFIVNITNEAWFGKTAAPRQFVSMNVLRAVENRVYLVRSANTGVSCFIDPHGSVVDRVRDASGEDLFVRGILTGEVVPLNSRTFYTRYGDWFPWLCILCSLGFLSVAFLRKG